MEECCRPALCRLCQCPVGADGVRVSELNQRKLSKWWSQALQVKRQKENMAGMLICQFCLWDAILVNKEGGGIRECDWWKGHDTNQFYKKFYYEDCLIRQCAVVIQPLKIAVGEEDPGSDSDPHGGTTEATSRSSWGVKPGIPTKCAFCSKTFVNRLTVLRHVQCSHQNEEKTKCITCNLIFKNNCERDDHVNNFHKVECHLCDETVTRNEVAKHLSEFHTAIQNCNNCCGIAFKGSEKLLRHFYNYSRRRTCVYCKKCFWGIAKLRKHIKSCHSHLEIQCHYLKCSEYFETLEKKQKHIKEIHESRPGLIECIYCKCKMIRNFLPRHVLKRHKSVYFRCGVKFCLYFFHTEEEKIQHELQFHFAAGSESLPEAVLSSLSIDGSKCVFCPDSFQNKKAAFEHVLEKHKDRSKFNCLQCQLVFDNSSDLSAHKKLVHSSRKCHICSTSVRKIDQLVHLAKFHPTVEQSRECCGQTFETTVLFLRHVFSICGTKTRCVYCNKCIKQRMHQHVQLHHAAEAITCPYNNCQRYFASTNEKDEHVSLFHENKQGLVECVYCNCMMAPVQLSKHVLKFHKSESVRCSFKLCLSYFHTDEEKKQHELSVHFATKGPQKFTCVYCGKSYPWKSDLCQHVTVNHRHESFKCKVVRCWEYFLSDSDLQSHHLEKHADEEKKKPWKCDHCSFRTKTKSHLVRHVDRLHDVSEHKCRVCHKVCKTLEDLKSHINLAHRKRPVCVHCKSQVKNELLYQHLKVRPCELCKDMFLCMGLKRKHRISCSRKNPHP